VHAEIKKKDVRVQEQFPTLQENRGRGKILKLRFCILINEVWYP